MLTSLPQCACSQQCAHTKMCLLPAMCSHRFNIVLAASNGSRGSAPVYWCHDCRRVEAACKSCHAAVCCVCHTYFISVLSVESSFGSPWIRTIHPYTLAYEGEWKQYGERNMQKVTASLPAPIWNGTTLQKQYKLKRQAPFQLIRVMQAPLLSKFVLADPTSHASGGWVV